MNALLELLRAESRKGRARRKLIVHDRCDRRHLFTEWYLRGDVLIRPDGIHGTEFWLPVNNINHITLG